MRPSSRRQHLAGPRSSRPSRPSPPPRRRARRTRSRSPASASWSARSSSRRRAPRGRRPSRAAPCRSGRPCAPAPTRWRGSSCPGWRSRSARARPSAFPTPFLLSASLEGGRALVEAQGRDALKVVTEEAEVRGQGRAVVRRQGKDDARHLPRRPVPRPGRRVDRHPRRGPGHGRPRRPRAVRAARPCRRRRPQACGPGRTRSTSAPGEPAGAALEGRRAGLPGRAAAGGLRRRAPPARRHRLARADRGPLGRCLPLARLGPGRARPRGRCPPRRASSPSTRSSATSARSRGPTRSRQRKFSGRSPALPSKAPVSRGLRPGFLRSGATLLRRSATPASTCPPGGTSRIGRGSSTKSSFTKRTTRT